MADITEIDPGILTRIDQEVQARNAGQLLGQDSDYGVPRRPFFLTCALWQQRISTRPDPDATGAVPQLIRLPVNPLKVNFKIGLRQADQRTRGGRILYVWRNRDRVGFLDEPVLTFQFQAGNILSTAVDGARLRIARGLKAFWNFMRLLDEEKIIPPRVGSQVPQNVGDPNYVIIEYSSRKFPLLRLKGFFNTDGVDFDDDALDPHRLDWTASFTVWDSVPRFSDAAGLQAAFQGEGETFLAGVPLITPGSAPASPSPRPAAPTPPPSPVGGSFTGPNPVGAAPAPQVGPTGPLPAAPAAPSGPGAPAGPVGSSFTGSAPPRNPGA